MSGRKTLTAETLPQGFTLGMAAADALPVGLFCGSAVLLGLRLHSLLFWLGAGLCIAAGTGKVLWKLWIALRQKNVWLLNRQMRVLMPLGFVLMCAALTLRRAWLSPQALAQGLLHGPSWVFFVLGTAGIAAMTVFARTEDGANAQANWKEEATNTFAQAAFFAGIWLWRG